MKNNFAINVRSVIQNSERILLCRMKGEDFYFLPGGHVEFGESVNAALIREIKEELGANVIENDFLGAVENIYQDKQQTHHEVNLVFEVELDKENIRVLEDHIEFHWVKVEDIAIQKILPIALKESLIKWLDDKKIFWNSQFD